MSYVGLKHLLAELALEAVRDPAGVGWPPVAAAYAELGAAAPGGRVLRAEVLARAATLAHAAAPGPSGADLDHLVSRGLLSAPDDRTVALREVFLPHAAYLRRHAPRLLGALAELRRSALSDAVAVGGSDGRAQRPADRCRSAPSDAVPIGGSDGRAERPADPGRLTPSDAPREVRIGAALFNHGLFFECHEWFEGVWKAAPEPEKDLYQGLVQAAAAFYHFEKDNRHGRVVLLRKAQARLARYPSRVQGLDLGSFLAALARWETHFTGGPRPEAFPVMTLLPPAEDTEHPARGSER